MEAFMSHILIADLIPIFVVMLLGYLSGKKNAFSQDQTRSFNKLVLDFALPAALFVSIVKADRKMLFDNAALSLISLVGLVVLFMLSYFTVQWFFKRSKAEGAVCALIAGSPTIGFLGFAVLDPIFGTGVETGLVIGIVAIVVNAVTIPLGLYLLNAGNKSAAKGAKKTNALVEAFKEPVVWTPVLAVTLVLLGIRVPDQIDPTFDMIAKVNSGVAVFAAGLTLSAYKIEIDLETIWNTVFKLVLMPAVFLAAGLMAKLPSEVLQMLVLSVALPPAFSGIIIASKYQIYTRTGTSSLAVSVLGFVIAAPGWIFLTRMLAH